MDVLVTGGICALGHQVVTPLGSPGHRARILRRHPSGHADAVECDLATVLASPRL
jgi:hypothetical protein